MYFLLYSFMNKLMSLRNKKKLHFVSVCLVISLELVCLLALEWFYLTREIDRFTVTQQKKKIENRLVKEAKKMICYKRLIFKQFVQVSGLFGPQFLSYLPKRFTHLCRALYGDAILVYRFGEINKNIWSSLFL